MLRYPEELTPPLVFKVRSLVDDFKSLLDLQGNTICSYDYKVVEGNLLLSVVVVHSGNKLICANYHPVRKAVQETYRLKNGDRYMQHKETLASLTRLYQS